MTFERFYRDFVVIFGRFLAVLISKGVITKKDADFITCQISEDEWRESETGEWIEIDGGCYICSNCEDIEAYTPNFCPNCGAKMQKGGAE